MRPTISPQPPQDEPGKLFNYYCVEFVQRGRKPHTRPVDVVNGIWLRFDLASKKVKSFYPENPETESYQLLLESLSPADEKWPVYRVILRGKSDDLGEALDKLEELKTSVSALTLSSSDDLEKAEQREIDNVRKYNLMKGAATYSNHIMSTLKNKELSTKAVGTQNNTDAATAHTASAAAQYHVGNVDPSKSTKLAGKISSTKSLGNIRDSSSSTSNQLAPNISKQSKLGKAPLKFSTIHGEKSSHRSYSEESLTLQGKKPNNNGNRTQSTQKSVLKELKHLNESVVALATKVQDNTEEILSLKNMILKISDKVPEDFVGSVQAFAEKYQIEPSDGQDDDCGFDIPIITLKQFDNFEAALDKGGDIVSSLKDILRCKLHKELIISKSMVGMFKLILSRDIALKFTATKEVKNKRVIYNTRLCTIIIGLIKERRQLANMSNLDDEYKKKLSEIFTNVRKWTGNSTSPGDSCQESEKNGSKNVKRVHNESSNEQQDLDSLEKIPGETQELSDVETEQEFDQYGRNDDDSNEDNPYNPSDSHESELEDGDENVEIPNIPILNDDADNYDE
ncbi:hypothetical protein QAD02_007721 [Eretmocerus hayati]|uniref:Uncharacterized protein n=1 Tax=Eretmocerus hayati TaxID=131215 RepID=A0ACC2N4U2_9HYME|nr:hypothetical protein QAD02_007721 [Eretmocerus hayati]